MLCPSKKIRSFFVFLLLLDSWDRDAPKSGWCVSATTASCTVRRQWRALDSHYGRQCPSTYVRRPDCDKKLRWDLGHKLRSEETSGFFCEHVHGACEMKLPRAHKIKSPARKEKKEDVYLPSDSCAWNHQQGRTKRINVRRTFGGSFIADKTRPRREAHQPYQRATAYKHLVDQTVHPSYSLGCESAQFHC